jgi:hypothetical protein
MTPPRLELTPHRTTIRPDGGTETLTRVIVGWDSSCGAFYLHVWTLENPTPYGYPSIAYDDEPRFPPDPTTIIQYARQHATVPEQLATILTRDAETEGFYTGPMYTSHTGYTLTERCQRIREHFGLTDCPF